MTLQSGRVSNYNLGYSKMTLFEIQTALREALTDIAGSKFDVDIGDIAVETPPKIEFGDVAFPIAFEMAKRLKQATGVKRNPREIAQALGDGLSGLTFIDRVEIAGAGYLNVFVDRSEFLRGNMTAETLPRLAASRLDTAEKACVEHTSVNPNKAAHIGHVRNSVLGDTFQRVLKATGKRVEVQNYIDNTGVQVADVVVGFKSIRNMSLGDIKALDIDLKEAGKSFDYYCWDLYAEVGVEYPKNDELKAKRSAVLHEIEAGGNETADLAEYVATRNVECILDTMERLSVRYDLLPRESEILHLHFWDRAFAEMKRLEVIRYESDGAHAGCWVMPVDSHAGTDDHEADKILVRSNGTVTYTGKDIAYQMWKLGILGLDFHYKKFYQYPDGRDVWITTTIADASAEDVPTFGGGTTIYNVIDSRQSYPQDIVKKGVAAIAPDRGEEASIHLAYEMVALSPAAAAELGFELSDDDKRRSQIEMSGRKGLGVKADDLIDRLEKNALREVEARHPDASDADRRKIAHQLAVGALRYFLLKFTRNTVIIFDFKEALSFEGETGCFCQYSAVRANSVFRKLDELGNSVTWARENLQTGDELKTFLHSADGDDVWSLIFTAQQLEEVIRQAADANEPAILAKYTFGLAKEFNLFYHRFKIIAETDVLKKSILIVAADLARRSLTAALDTMGIEVPERM